MSADAPASDQDILRRAGASILERLPAGWTGKPIPGPALGNRRPDGFVEITAPDGQSVTLVFEAKRVLEGRDVVAIRLQLQRYLELLPNGEGVVVARYLSPPVRQRLTEAGLSFVDATGNVRILASKPGLFIADRGSDHDPWRGPGRPRGTMKGAPAGKVARALADFAGPWSMRQLVAAAQVSTGASYRVIDFLEREGLVNREESGEFLVPDWSAVLRRWSDDYGFVRSNHLTRWIAPRGLPDLLKKVALGDVQYAITGTLAASQWAEFAPARSAMIYTPDANRAAEHWGLRPADAGANTMLAEPTIDVVFARTLIDDRGVVSVAPTQVVVDMLTGPGRAPSEGEALLKWLQQSEGEWRS